MMGWSCSFELFSFSSCYSFFVGRDCVVCAATRYRQDVPGIESWWGGRDVFRTRTNPTSGPPSLLHNGYRTSFPGVKRLGHPFDHPHRSSAEVKDRVDLYLTSSLDLQGYGVNFICTLTVTHMKSDIEIVHKHACILLWNVFKQKLRNCLAC